MLSGNITQQAHYTQSITQPSSCIGYSNTLTMRMKLDHSRYPKLFKFHPGTVSPSSLYPFLSS